MLTLEHIQGLGYPHAQEVAKEVFLIEDFLLPDEIDALMAFAEGATQEDWEKEYNKNLVSFAERKFKRTDIDNLVKEGKLEITHNWSDKAIQTPAEIRKELDARLKVLFDAFPEVQVNGSGILQRQYAGVPLVAHVDNHTDPSLVYAAVFYINDNYNGGNVHFDRLGLEMKPRAGSLLIFPTGEDHFHGVRVVEPGPTRYVIPSFVGKRDFYLHNTF